MERPLVPCFTFVSRRSLLETSTKTIAVGLALQATPALATTRLPAQLVWFGPTRPLLPQYNRTSPILAHKVKRILTDDGRRYPAQWLPARLTQVAKRQFLYFGSVVISPADSTGTP